jgi:Tol biopolymer transport system component
MYASSVGRPEGEGSETDGLAPTVEAPDGGAVAQTAGPRYRIVRSLGRGGMGEVHLAVDVALGTEVALKRVGDDTLARLRDEVRLAQRVTHPNVCRTFDLEEVEGRWLVKMEYVDGTTLADRLRRGPLSVQESVRIAIQICAGLAAAHRRGVVHRDLKPHNVMIERGTDRVVLMDFGIARVSALAGTTAEQVSGTPDYMAPEQVRGREVDGRADLYALGCVLHEMLTGSRVFPRGDAMAAALAHVNDPPPPLPASVPPRVARVVARLLKKEPALRPADAEEVAAQLRGPGRRRAWALAGAVVLASAAAGAALIATRTARPWRPAISQLPVHDENCDSLAISPDGERFAFSSDRETRGHFRVYVGAVAGGPDRAITPREMMAGDVRWQDDGAALLVSADEKDGSRLMRFPVDGGPAEVLAEDASDGDDCAGRLLFVRGGAPGCPGCKQLVLRETGGQERELLRVPARASIRRPRCDDAGRRVAYVLDDRGTSLSGETSGQGVAEMWLLDIAGGSPRRVADDASGVATAFTPGGSSIVYAGRGGHLWELSVEGERVPVQVTFGDGWEGAPSISRDGRLLLYNVDITWAQLHAQPSEGGVARKLTTAPWNLLGLRATLDGRAIIAQARPRGSARNLVVSVPVEGGDPVVLAEGATPGITVDGAEVLYTVDDGRRVMAIPRAGGAPRQVTEVPGPIRSLHAGPDGRVHLAVARAEANEAWSAPLAGGVAERELPAPWTLVVPAPAGRWRAVSNGRRIRLLAPGMAVDDPAARELGPRGTWTSDGGSWLELQPPGTAVWHRMEGGEARVVVLDGDVLELAPSPDGKTIYTNELVSHIRRELITNFADRPRP